MATPYALLATLIPLTFARAIQIGLLLVGIVMVALFSYWAYRERNISLRNRVFTFSFALLLPLLISPHTLIYDLLILVPSLILLANVQEFAPTIKYISIAIYLCLLFLPLLGYIVKVALPGIIPLFLYIFLLVIYFRINITTVLSWYNKFQSSDNLTFSINRGFVATLNISVFASYSLSDPSQLPLALLMLR
jgi:hypothetical protein